MQLLFELLSQNISQAFDAFYNCKHLILIETLKWQQLLKKHEKTTRKRTSKKLDRSVKSAWLDTEKFDLILNVEHRPCQA